MTEDKEKPKYTYTYKKRLTIQIKDKPDIVIERTWENQEYLWGNFGHPDSDNVWYMPEGDNTECRVRTSEIISVKEDFISIKDNTSEIDASTPEELKEARELYRRRK